MYCSYLLSTFVLKLYVFDFQIETMKEERTHALETKSRLILMKTDLDSFTNGLKKAKKSEYEVREMRPVP